MSFNIVIQGCYCERLLTTGSNNQPTQNASGKLPKDGEEKSVRCEHMEEAFQNSCLAIIFSSALE